MDTTTAVSSTLTHRSGRPRNVEQITKAAQDYEYSAVVGMRYWLRTAGALLKEAQIYEREGDDEQAYFLLFRHAHLILTNLAAHPDLKDKTIKPIFAQAQREVNENLKRLDALKPRINERYDRYNKLLRERGARKAVVNYERQELQDRTDSPPIQHLHAYEHQDFAVELAQKEISRRAAARDINFNAVDAQRLDRDDLSKRLQDVRARVEPQRGLQPDRDHSPPYGRPSTASYKYPTVPAHRTEDGRQQQTILSSTSRDPRNTNLDTLPPALPPKLSSQTAFSAPTPPEKVSSLGGNGQTKQAPSYTFASTATLEDGTPLRTIFLPPTLRTTFLRLAHSNTLANLETCAFLAGTLISNALFISKLILPAQTATSDTCEMTNESQLFDLVDAEADLMILGWIHTHPRQTCFMSSRDLHTHAGYQMMLAESIAIVCAPSKGDTSHGGDWGIYRLTDPPGKKAILACQKPGIFHPHEVDNVYTDALRPGHVIEAKGLEFDVVDLRE